MKKVTKSQSEKSWGQVLKSISREESFVRKGTKSTKKQITSLFELFI